MAEFSDSDNDSIFEGFDESDLLTRARDTESDSDIEVSSVSSVDSADMSDFSDKEASEDHQWTGCFTNFWVSPNSGS